MLESWGVFIKLAVDIEQEILAGGSQLHYECEEVLLKAGSKQKDIWGADWYPYTQFVGFESIINIRPSQNNRTMEIRSPEIRSSSSFNYAAVARRIVMPDWRAIETSFLRQPKANRLGELAASLARLSSRCQNPANLGLVAAFTEESLFFVGLIIQDTDIEKAGQLNQLQSHLREWQQNWSNIWANPTERMKIAAFANTWSEQVLGMSGLLSESITA